MFNVMLDLETWSTQPNAAIRSIGACVFDADGVGDRFYRNIFNSCGLHVDENTVAWWHAQSQEAKDALMIDQRDLLETLIEFTAFLPEPHNQVLIWGNGSDFDNVILANAFNHLGLKLPWKYYNNRCYRTVKNLFPIVSTERKGTKHNALDDAVFQAEHLIGIQSKLLEHFHIDLFNPEFTNETMARTALPSDGLTA